METTNGWGEDTEVIRLPVTGMVCPVTQAMRDDSEFWTAALLKHIQETLYPEYPEEPKCVMRGPKD